MLPMQESVMGSSNYPGLHWHTLKMSTLFFDKSQEVQVVDFDVQVRQFESQTWVKLG